MSKREKNEVEKTIISDRNARVIFIITLIGGISYFQDKLVGIFEESFSTYYINGSPFGFAQFLITSVITSFIFVIWFMANYVYCEAFSFGNFESKADKIKYLHRAEKSYRRLLSETKIFGVVFAVSCLVLMLFFGSDIELTLVGKIIVICFFISIVGLFIALIIFVTKQKISELCSEIGTSFWSSIKKVNYVYMFFWIILYLVVFLVGIAILDSKESQLEAKFISSESGSVDLIFHNKSPQEVDVFVNEDKNKILLSNADFDRSFYEVIGSTIQNSDSNNFLFKLATPKQQLDNSDFLYRKTVILGNYLHDGKNYIAITFTIDSEFQKKNYKIVDEVDKKGKSLHFLQDDIKVSL